MQYLIPIFDHYTYVRHSGAPAFDCFTSVTSWNKNDG